MSKVLMGAAIAVVAVGVLFVLSGSELRRSGTNNVIGDAKVVRLAPGERKCQPGEIPPDTEAIAVPASLESPAGRLPRLGLAVESDGGRRVAIGSTTGAAPDGRVLAPMHPPPGQGAAKMCIHNRGGTPVTLLGQSEMVAVDYYAGRQTWWQAAPAVASRFGFGKAGPIGPWMFWVALALVGVAWVAGWRALADSSSRS